ncbi:transcriptional corepressor LEUNIG_HOMOLOG isoform X1 [Elaeis guineensis]|uniref:Transcriptional corepressor LEUNIG_HOMOLOG isoform X1 n=1 Tax=Elaeis guineensis var. tenera TaxID=51953 RepID=A0A6I9S2L7_ELAGV|nr:transcriptional corepressor LEUNIG_HOMOLOG isoform X1 [Elaeis guineensis]XP_010936001.1 transcriptional corepressor LEUNIG_HOMOLOG isoform X1 [Elaeis guineensis]XP_029123580.1 transcriptional corepressor LEUNIG_HOMOLOG isoform X1 [Elaeis guineensis]XP_029123581.1 transcriptional corepressor LEUNIG_HOMOLOG isoform X1 [Elaeis guineensis]
MAHSNWEADKMLDVYIYDYLVKRNLQTTAKAFMAEGKVAADPVAIDAPGGFLFEWWSVFWDIFIARTNEKHSEVAVAYIEAQQIKAREHQQQLQMQQLQLMQQRHAHLQRTNANHPSFSGPINTISSDGVLGSSTASVLAAKMYEERLKNPHSIESDASPQLLDASRMALLKSAANHPGQLMQGNPGNVSATLQQIQARTPQATDIKSEANMAVAQRSLPMDPSSIYGPGIIQSKSGLGGAGLNQGVSGLPLKGWPLTGIDQIRPNIGPQMQKPFLSTQSQFQLLSQQQQQQLLAQAQAQGNLGNLPNYGDLDPRRFRALPRGGLNAKDGQPAGTDGSIGSPIQSNSPKVRQDPAEYLMKLKVPQMQHSSAQQPQEQFQQQQQLQQTNRKRKQPSSSGAANSTGTGNTVGPSPNSPPSTPSTHNTGDVVAMAGNIRHVNSMPKSLMMYGTDGTGGLASSSNQMDDLEPFGDVGSLDDNVESFLSHDDGDARDIFAALKKSPAEPNPGSSKGFAFTEVGSSRISNNKVVCCHFSSDGKLLASAGHEKKVILWNMDTLQTESTPEEHSQIITDVRFRPNSTQLATSSFDRTVRLWNAADPSFCLNVFSGHNSQVTSLDFHPKKTDIFCSCDSNGEIRYWSADQFSFSRVSKGGTVQVRFQPNIGQYLAAAAENVVSIFDVETDRKIYTFQGHTKGVQSICWDNSGEYLACVSQDCVKVWSLSRGDFIHELSSNGNKFNSCVFHPNYTNLLVIGGYQSLELWNVIENQTMKVQAHEGLIAALAQAQVTGMVASASHDKSVKLWRHGAS